MNQKIFIIIAIILLFIASFFFFIKQEENIPENKLPSTPVITDEEKVVEVLDEEKIKKITNDSYLNILLQIKTFDSLNINYEPLLEAAMRIARELDLYKIPDDGNTYIEYVSRDIVHELIYELSGIRINEPIIIEDFYYLYDSDGDYYYIVPIGSEWLELQELNSIHYTSDSDQYIIHCSAENLTDYAIKTTYPDVELRLKYKASNNYIKYQLISIHAGKSNTQVIEPENNSEYYYFENENPYSGDFQ